MGCCTILRHGGRRPAAAFSKIRKSFARAINMSFDDGHGELVKLQNLWNYTWHLNGTPPKSKALKTTPCKGKPQFGE